MVTRRTTRVTRHATLVIRRTTKVTCHITQVIRHTTKVTRRATRVTCTRMMSVVYKSMGIKVTPLLIPSFSV